MPTTIEESPFYTIKEIARYCRVTEPIVREWIECRGLPAYRFMGHYRIKERHFEEWYESFLIVSAKR